MSDFDDMLQEDMETFLADFGEEVLYIPRNETHLNPRRIVKAIVQRDPPVARGWNQQAIQPKLRITVINKAYRAGDTVHGIHSATLDTGGDKVRVAILKGDTPEELRISLPADNMESHDAGALNLILG